MQTAERCLLLPLAAGTLFTQETAGVGRRGFSRPTRERLIQPREASSVFAFTYADHVQDTQGQPRGQVPCGKTP